MAGVSLSGMASGLDTETIITQLMAIEAKGKTRLTVQQKYVDARRTVMDEVARQIRGLNTAIADLRSVTTFGDTQTLTSSDAAKVAARRVGAGPVGSFDVVVSKLARAEQKTFTWEDTLDGGGLPQIQDLSISDGTTTKSFTFAAGTSLADVATQINGTSGITVYAGVVGGQLTLTAKELGKDVDVTSATGTVVEDLAKQKLGNLNEFSINGVDQTPTKESVVTSGGLPGIELTLKAVGTSAITIGAPGPDTEKIKTKVQAFVDAYNATVDLVRGKLTEKKVANPSTTADFQKGALRSDPALSAMLSSLRQVVGGVGPDMTTSLDTLAEIGITPPKPTAGGTTSPEARAGKLTLDVDKLLSALKANPAEVDAIFRGATGVGQQLAAAVEPVVRTSDGYFTRRAQAADQETERIKTQTADIDRRLALKEDRLRRQFSVMETALNGSQSQSGWLSGQIAGLPTW